MSFRKKIVFEMLTVLLGLFSAVFGVVFILFLAIVLWQISGYAVGALLGVLSVLFFIMARAALRFASESSKKQMPEMSEAARLQEAKQLFPSLAARIDRHIFRK
jgi:hypothetical protein